MSISPARRRRSRRARSLCRASRPTGSINSSTRVSSSGGVFAEGPSACISGGASVANRTRSTASTGSYPGLFGHRPLSVDSVAPERRVARRWLGSDPARSACAAGEPRPRRSARASWRALSLPPHGSHMLTEVTFQIATLHAAATNRRCSRSSLGHRPESSSSGVSTVRSASSTFSRASTRVRPWLRAPGTSSTRATIQPSSSGSSKAIVKSIEGATGSA